jgi:polyisoprenoid-binding protein YceI
MSTTDTQVLPAGTWQVDKVHSSIAFGSASAGTTHCPVASRLSPTR